MKAKSFCYVVAILIIFVMFFLNKKVCNYLVLKEQIKVFKNAKKNKYSRWDIFCFIIFPIILGNIITIGIGKKIDDNLAGILTTVFSFIFTVLFGFAAILVGKKESENEIEKLVVSETIVSIMTCNLLSLISAIISMVIICIKNKTTIVVLSICVYSFSFMIIMLLLLVSKRTFIIYCDPDSESNDKD